MCLFKEELYAGNVWDNKSNKMESLDFLLKTLTATGARTTESVGLVPKIYDF